MSTLEHTHAPPAPPRPQPDELTVSVVIPCLNEEENIEAASTARAAP